MNFGHTRRVFLGCITLAVVMAGYLLLSGYSQATAQAICGGSSRTPLALNSMTFSSSEGETICYRVSVPAFTARVEIAFSPFLEGNYDLYWANGSDMDLIASDLGPSQDTYVLNVTSYRPVTSTVTTTLAVVPKFTSSSSRRFTIGVFAKDARGAIVDSSAGADSGTGNLGSIPAGGKFISVRAHSSVSRRFSARCGIINIEANWLDAAGNGQNLQLVLYDPANRPVRTVPVGRATGNIFTILYPISADQVKTSSTWTVKYVNNGPTSVRVWPRVRYPKGACPKPAPKPTQTTVRFQNGRYPTSSYVKAREAVLSQAEPNVNDKTQGCLADGDDPPGTGKDKETLLYWDVGTIPDGARVVDASITLNVFNATNDTYYLYGMNRRWDGNQATWNRARNGRNWYRPGAQGGNDRNFTKLGELRGAAKGQAVIKLNSTGRSLLESWINGTKPNYGFILANDSAVDGLDFYCSTSSTVQRRPLLTVVYEQPTVTTVRFQKGRYPTGGYVKAREAVLSQAEPNVNDKTKGCLADGDDPPGTRKDKATLLYWDVETIPDGKRVVDASVTLYVFNETNDTYYLYGMNRRWDGDQATWNKARNGRNWHRLGAQGGNDRNFTTLGELRGAAKGPAIIKLNSAGRSLLESWINGTKPNYGFILANDSATDGVDFYCSTSSTVQQRPMLTVVSE